MQLKDNTPKIIAILSLCIVSIFSVSCKTVPEIEVDPADSILELSEQAQENFERKEYYRAIAYYQAIIKKAEIMAKLNKERDAELSKAAKNASLSDEQKKEYQALALKREKIEKDKAWAYYEIGFCYYYMEEYEDAIKYFDIVINQFSVPAPKTLAGNLKQKIMAQRYRKRKKEESSTEKKKD